jgi:hypothetical protein
MNEEVWRNLAQAKMASCDHRLIRLIAGFDDTVGGVHADREEARSDHDRIPGPSVQVSMEIINSEEDWVLEVPSLLPREEFRIVKAPIENFEPADSRFRIQSATRNAEQSLAV